MWEKNLVFVLAFVALSNAASAPLINRCKSEDTKCAKNSAQAMIPIFAAGISEFGVEQLDPVFFKQINATKANLKFLLNDVTITGLNKCQARKIHRDVAKSKLFLKFLCDAFLVAQYELGGRVLILPVEGNGKLSVALKKASISIEADMGEKTGADGIDHWHIKSWKHSYELKDNAKIVFENLFNGNEQLGRAANDLLENNSNEVVKEIGSPVIHAVVHKVIENVNNMFNVVSPKDLSID